MGTIEERTPKYIYKDCADCFSDSYDVELANMLYFVIFDKVPSRILELNDQEDRARTSKRVARTRKNYQYEKCNLGNYHLNCIGRNFKGRKRIAMLKETLALLEEAHGDEHADEA